MGGMALLMGNPTLFRLMSERGLVPPRSYGQSQYEPDYNTAEPTPEPLGRPDGGAGRLYGEPGGEAPDLGQPPMLAPQPSPPLPKLMGAMQQPPRLPQPSVATVPPRYAPPRYASPAPIPGGRQPGYDPLSGRWQMSTPRPMDEIMRPGGNGIGDVKQVYQGSAPQSTGRKILNLLPRLAVGAIAGGATQNIAGGGAADVFRAMQGGSEALQNRDLMSYRLRQQATQEEMARQKQAIDAMTARAHARYYDALSQAAASKNSGMVEVTPARGAELGLQPDTEGHYWAPLHAVGVPHQAAETRFVEVDEATGKRMGLKPNAQGQYMAPVTAIAPVARESAMVEVDPEIGKRIGVKPAEDGRYLVPQREISRLLAAPKAPTGPFANLAIRKQFWLTQGKTDEEAEAAALKDVNEDLKATTSLKQGKEAEARAGAGAAGSSAKKNIAATEQGITKFDAEGIAAKAMTDSARGGGPREEDAIANLINPQNYTDVPQDVKDRAAQVLRDKIAKRPKGKGGSKASSKLQPAGAPKPTPQAGGPAPAAPKGAPAPPHVPPNPKTGKPYVPGDQVIARDHKTVLGIYRGVNANGQVVMSPAGSAR